MEATNQLPSIKGDVKFEYAGEKINLVVDLDGEERLEFSRSDKRWRYVGGPLVSSHTIASQIFTYSENPSTDEMHFMGDYVDDVGRLIDVAYQVICDGSSERMRRREEMRQQLAMQRFERVDVVESSSSGFVVEQTFVYLMKHVNGLTKIGQSKNPKTREKTLQAEDPRLEMVFCCEGDVYVERRLHKIFDSQRVRGEWFDLKPHHVDWIKAVLRSMADASS